jgi:xylose isomerase
LFPQSYHIASGLFCLGKRKDFKNRKLSLQDLYKMAQENGELQLKSSKQELFENIINQYI